MSAAPRVRDRAFACALVLGVLGDLLVRVEGRPGLNVALWALAGAAVLWLLSRHREAPVSTETCWLVGGAVAFGALLVLRDADALAVLCLFSAVVLLGLAAGRAALAWAGQAHMVEVGIAAIRVAALIAMGPLGWSVGAARQADEPTSRGAASWPGRVRIVGRGLVLALPPLIVLTALLTSADPVFERLLHDTLFAGIEPLLEDLIVVGVIAWLSIGYLRAFFVNDGDVAERVRIPRPALASSEITIALSLVSLLFVVFLAVQVRYLFGGAGLIEVTEGLSYAEYARRGFFEMVAAAAFVVPVLLLADWAAADGQRGERTRRAISTLLVLLLGGVLASAAYRMWLYQEAYGLTEQRLYGSVFMVWLTFVLVWLAATVLRGRRRGFVFGAIVAGLACVVALHVLNPHAMIARVNIDRAISGVEDRDIPRAEDRDIPGAGDGDTAGAEYDGAYLATLSADAVPTLIARLPVLPEIERCRVAEMLEERWSGERPGGWRTWNLGDARARSMVAKLRVRDCNG